MTQFESKRTSVSQWRVGYGLLVLAACMVSACQGEAPQDAAPASSSASQGAPGSGNAQAGNADGQGASDALTVSEIDPALRQGATWTAKACSLTTEGGDELTADEGSVKSFEGYLIGPDNEPAGSFDFVLRAQDGRAFKVATKTGSSRPDVAEYFKTPSLESAGYNFSASLDGLPAGRYAVDFMLERSGVQYFCESGKHLVVR